ncbi:MAG: hypothetical protein Kow0065_09020 [Methylomicrobium sp.]
MAWLIRLGCLLPFFLCCPPSSYAQAVPITVTAILSHDAAPYRDVLQGVRQAFAAHRLDIALDVHVIEENVDKISVKEAALSAKPQAVLSLGSLATEFAVSQLPELPLCAGLIVDRSVLGSPVKATASTLKFPLEIEMQWLKKFIGAGKTIAVLYDRNKNADDLIDLQHLARRDGLDIYPLPVDGSADLLDALKRLPQQTAAIWSFAESGLLNAQTAKHALLYSFRNRVPLIGLSSQWTKAGALYSLDRDYIDIGVQCGEKLLQILNGTPPERIPIEPPRKVLYSVNLKTLRHMKLEVPEYLIQGADEVF